MNVSTQSARIALVSLVVIWSASALADPPAHAPAHGWRKKQNVSYVGHSGRQWEHDFSIASGSCNREEIATVVGGVVGGAIAARVADEHRTVATIIGIAAGALIGNKIGEKLDEADRACVGHALEVGDAGRPVVWTNEATGVRYEVSPGEDRRRDGASCREFSMTATDGRDKSSRSGLACESDGGVWEIVG